MISNLFISELRKLLTRRIGVAVLLLLTLNLLSLHFMADRSAEKYERLEPYREAFAQLEQVCSSDPEYYAAYYLELKEERDAAYKEWEANQPLFPEIGEVEDPIVAPFEYKSPSTIAEGYEDYVILDRYVYYMSDFRTVLGGSVTNAQNNLAAMERFGINTDTPTGDYQRKMIELYSGILEETDATSSLVLGWDEFLSYENGIIFLFLASMLLAVQIGLADRESGFEPVLRTCRRGRWQPAVAKCVTIVVALAGIAILFTLTEIIYIALRFGLSSPLRSLQNVSGYVFAPYAICILDGVLLGLLGRVLSASLLGAITLLLTALTRQVVLPLIVSGLFTVANLLLHWISLFGEWRVFNLFEPASGDLLKRTPVIALQGFGNSLYPLMIGILALLLIAFSIGAVITYHLRRPTSKVRSLPKLTAIAGKLTKRSQSTPKRLKVRKPSLMRGELQKLLSPLLVAAILLLVGVRTYQAIERFEITESDVDSRKRDYADRFGGVMTDEKAEALNAEYDYAVGITNEELRQENMVAYAMGEMSGDDYYAYQLEYAKASAALPVLSEEVAHVVYLQAKAAETGLETVYFFDGGYVDFFNIALDLPLYLLVLLGLSAIFAKEYAGDSSKGGFIQILRTTKNGRTPVFVRKLAWAAIYSCGLTLAFAALDLFLLWRGEGLPALSAPLVSMERYADVASSITVGGYLVICVALRTLGALVLALLTTTLSCLLKNTKLVLALTAAITLLPYALYYFGIKHARYFDFTALLSGDRLWLTSWEQGSVALLVGFVAVVVAITAGLAAVSYRKFCK